MESIEALAMSGAATLVGAMATDAWQAARSAIARLFGHGDKRRQEVAETRLDHAAAEVENADAAQRDQVRERLMGSWQTRLADLLEENPQEETELRLLIDRLRRQLPPSQQAWVQNVSASAPGAVAQGVMGGNIINYPSGTTPGNDGTRRTSGTPA
jgi:hypothetical protein